MRGTNDGRAGGAKHPAALTTMEDPAHGAPIHITAGNGVGAIYGERAEKRAAALT